MGYLHALERKFPGYSCCHSCCHLVDHVVSPKVVSDFHLWRLGGRAVGKKRSSVRKKRSSRRNVVSAKGKLRNSRCFVLSPIGEPGSVTREHANRVCTEIIDPALCPLGFEPHRIDQKNRNPGGSIPAAIVQELRESPLCVAVLTELNPNVMFEVGVRQAWDLPIIHLCEFGTDLPFDIRSRDTVFYSLSNQENVDQAQKQLADRAAEHARKLESIPPGVVPVISEVFGRAMEILGRRYALDPVFRGKRDAMVVLRDQLRNIGEQIRIDIEKGSANPNSLADHADSVAVLARELRAKVHVFHELATNVPKRGPRLRCEPLLVRMKDLQSDLNTLMRHLKDAGSTQQAFDTAEQIVNDMIDRVESIKSDCVRENS